MAFVHPESGRFLRVNDALCRLLGRSREQLMALTVDDVAHPEDRANGQEGRRAMVNGNASSFETEKRYYRG
jgi:PAS domain S-box-containing protein